MKFFAKLSPANHLSILILASASMAACQAVKQVRNFAQCVFRLQSLDKFSVAGVDFSGKKSLSDFNFADAAKITAALTGNSPLTFNFVANVEVQNPNPVPASIGQMDWILEIDGKEILSGALQQRIQVAPHGGLASMPLLVSFDLKKLFANPQRDTVLGFIFDTIAKGNDNPRLAFKIKPYVNIAGLDVPYPGYISLKKDF